MSKGEYSIQDVPRRVFRLFTSYGLMVVVLFFMLVLTLLGTLEQTNRGIYDVQEEYFDAAFVVHHFGDFPLPLPGGYLLMVLLFLNLLCGAIIRARKDWRRPGMLVAHSGILVLLLGGMVSTHFSKRGYLQLFESEKSNEFVSFFDWQLEIGEVGEDGNLSDVLVIPPDDLKNMRRDEQRVFVSEELPFELVVNGYARNARPEPVTGEGKRSGRVVDGFVLRPAENENEAELNIPGLYGEFREKKGGGKKEAILWGGAIDPFTLESGGKKWAIRLTKMKWEVPFDVRLDEFVAEYHPGSDIPAKFESYITKIENGVEEKVKIWMNHPLRHEGYTFFQRSFGRGEGPMAGQEFSVFDVVKNPADQWPLYSLIIVGVGLLVHFVQKLTAYLKGARVSRAAEA